MKKALKDVPVEEHPVPEGFIQSGNDYYYAEYPPGAGIRSLGISGSPSEEADTNEPAQDEASENEVKNELF
jgi:penicillin-binding protein 1A